MLAIVVLSGDRTNFDRLLSVGPVAIGPGLRRESSSLKSWLQSAPNCSPNAFFTRSSGGDRSNAPGIFFWTPKFFFSSWPLVNLESCGLFSTSLPIGGGRSHEAARHRVRERLRVRGVHQRHTEPPGPCDTANRQITETGYVARTRWLYTYRRTQRVSLATICRGS